MSSGADVTSSRQSGSAPFWLHAGVLLTIAYVAWHLSGPGRTGRAQIVSLGGLTVLCMLAVWAMSRSSLRDDLPARVRTGLRYITAGLVMVMLGSLYLVVQYVAFGTAPNTFGLVDALFMAPYPLSMIGLMYFPRAEHLVASRWRILVDGVAFAVGAGVPLWLFAIEPVLRTTHGLDALLIVLWPIMAFCGIVAVNASLLASPPVPSRGAFWLMLGALGVSWVADLIFALDAAAKIVTHGSINWINITNALSLGLFMIAAWKFQSDPIAGRRKVRPAAVSPVPMITIVVVATWSVLVVAFGRPDPGMFLHLLVSLIFLLVILLVRESLVLRDSLRWVAAEAQRESQARFEAMVRHSSDVIMVVDRARRIHFASPATTKVLGRAPDELTGRELLELVHPEDTARGAAFFDDLLLHPDPDALRILRWRLRNVDGTFRHFETSGSNLLEESTVGGFVLNSRDVTERAMLEERLHQAQKMEAVGRLAGGVAHDFNNLLAVVLANSELALLSLPEGHEARAELEEIRRASTRGAALTGRLLAFGRRENLQPQVISPGKLLQDTAPFLQRLLGEGTTLATQYSGSPGSVRVDPHDLEQALINLATNARDAMPKTGGRLTVSLRAEVLAKALVSDYLAAQPGRYVVVAVADNGAGMDLATRARLFEPFFSTKERSKGAGLGLASVFGMMKTAGGGIVVRSAPGQGTVIELWLPEVTAAFTEAVSPPAPVLTRAVLPAGGETILLVEDEDGVRRATQRILESKGYKVLAAGGAQEARTVLLQPEARAVKLLLTDVIMPGQSGPVLAAEVVKQRPELRVLFMSGYTGDELRTEGLARAGGKLLIKPFTADELTARVHRALVEPVASV
jgi:PAS domain S-box-containing protein